MKTLTAEQQYLNLLKRIIDEGVWVENKRTGTRCLTVINADIEMDVGGGDFPLITTRKSYYRQAIGEILGYLRGYTKLSQFHALGVHTWDANANNPVWLDSIYNREPGEDLGMIYGAVGNNIPHIEYSRQRPNGEDLYIYPKYKQPWLKTLIQKIREDDDDRGLIWNFWNPAMFHLGCLRPCVYNHQFSLVGDTLYLNTLQRSCDTPLGLNFNLVQAWWLLWVMAKITNKKPGKVYYKIVNAHIYENQIEKVKEQLAREPYQPPKLIYTGKQELTEEYLFNELTPNDFDIVNYIHHPAIKYPFTV